MKPLPSDLYNKIKQINKDVKSKLRQRGLVVPVKDKMGNICVGSYKISKTQHGFYEILDYGNELIVDRINLPQTAAILANKLALGKFIDDGILLSDRKYGHALFEEELQSKIAVKSVKKSDLDRADLMFTKAKISKLKKEFYKSEVVKSYENLIRIR